MPTFVAAYILRLTFQANYENLAYATLKVRLRIMFKSTG